MDGTRGGVGGGALTSRRAPASRAWRLAGGGSVPVLGLVAGALAWRAAVEVDWRTWQAADALIVAIGAAGALAAARFALDVGVAVLAHRRGRAAPLWTGRAARTVAAALVATMVGAGAAHAIDEPPSAGWLPTEPSPAAVAWTPATATPAPARTREGAGAVAPGDRPAPGTAVRVVRPGDSLWSITAAALGPAASHAEVAAAWPRLYAANRAVVGPDPDLIHPGQRLALPAELTGAGA